MATPRIHVKTEAGRDLARGRLWVFQDQVERIEGDLVDGEPADAIDEEGRFRGRGLVSLESRLLLRVLVRQPVPMDRKFFRRRLKEAVQLRRQAELPRSGTNAYRLVFAEADGLPGLVVDRYAQHLVLSALTPGTQARKELLARELLTLTKTRAVIERSDTARSRAEGVADTGGTLAGTSETETIIEENGVRFLVDLVHGMKTGHFCDQRDNRLRARGLAEGGRTLDAFSYTGGFALNLAMGGARSVTAVDQAPEAIEALRRNIALNDLDEERFELVAADAFAFLRERAAAEPASHDVVVLDPPSFAHRRDQKKDALRGYAEIHRQGLRLVKDGGFLLSCSCTHYLDQKDLRDVVRRAGAESGRRLRLVGEYGHAPDHPVLLGHPEGEYLKAVLVQVLGA